MNNLKELLDSFSGLSLAVIGDICLDLYYFLSNEKSEISVETGLQTQSVSRCKHEAGGAANVAVNLKALGAGVTDLYGVIGDDFYGGILRQLLEPRGVNCSGIISQDHDWDTNVYHKVFREGREEPRYDMGNFNCISQDVQDMIFDRLTTRLDSYQAIIINEQRTGGFHNDYFQTRLKELIKGTEKEILWLCDSRHLNMVYEGTIRKLNQLEAREIYCRIQEGENREISDGEMAIRLRNYWGKPVVLTRGEEGAIGVDQAGNLQTIPGINLMGELDTVGGGDAFLAGLSLSLAAGADMAMALETANFTAAVSVTKLQETGHPTAQEVIEMGKYPDYRFRPELAADSRRAVLSAQGSVEIIVPGKRPFPRVAIFDHDGTISTLRAGWEPIMEKIMIEAILGKDSSGLSSQELSVIVQRVRKSIENTTGVQTIIQMHHLRDLVKSVGLVPDEMVLDAEGYKEKYNTRLMKIVSARRDRFARKELSLSDLTIKGVIDFLEWLNNRGVILYLASGTDQNDVREEAEFLGYGSLFSGGIYGSLGDIKNDPKRVVMERISKELPVEVSPLECFVFGDGPVEMREGVRRGFTTIGLMSNEKENYGVNREKRERLILGGAEFLIPDFSCAGELAEVLGWEYK